MTALLEVKNLKVAFKTHSNLIRAVRGVDFSIYPNETVGIVGESGCGKSVMVKALLKLFSSPSAYIEEGVVLYQNQNLMDLPEKHLRKIRGQEIGMIFQDAMTSLNPTMSIGKQILETLLYHFKISFQEGYTKTLHLLNLVGIHPAERIFSQYPHQLSGGMRQRVTIAIALALSPKILVADEPTTALDATIQAQILQLLKDIQHKTQTSIVFITHDLSIVAGFCDRVIVMYAGKIVEEAPVDKLFREPKHPYTKKLLESIPRLDTSPDKPLNPIAGAPPNLSLPIVGCSFAPRCPCPLNICFKEAPPLFSLSKDHSSACWHHDPRSSI